jgi:hypothetical protein
MAVVESITIDRAPVVRFEVERAWRAGAGAFTAAAGVLHWAAAGDHREHRHVLAFFVLVGAAQLVWAALVAVGSRRPALIRAGVVGSLGVVGVWIVSRTVGIPWVPDVGVAEPVGTPDVVTTALEVLTLAALAVSTSEARRGSGAVVVPRRSLGAAALAVVMLVAVPTGIGLASGGPAHDDDHTTVAGAVVADDGEAASWPGGEEATVRYGPFDLASESEQLAEIAARPGGGNVLRNGLEKPCVDCLLVSITPDLVDAEGRSLNLADGAMLHHAVFFDTSQDDVTCPRTDGVGFLGRRIFASGNERSGGTFPEGFGLPVQPTSNWLGVFHIMNHTETPRAVWVALTVRYRPVGDGTLPLTPVWLDMDNCGDSQFTVPAGRSETDWRWNSTVTGRVITGGGHLHDGGVSITYANGTTGELLCRSVASYGTDPAYAGSIESMTGCGHDRLGTVRAGEDLVLRTVYDTPRSLDDVMGIVVSYVHETDELSGGTLASDAVKAGVAEPTPPPPPPSDHAH